ncbi:MAG: hypothetical protein WA432_01355 [Candidatus Babeliaceae bacterium]
MNKYFLLIFGLLYIGLCRPESFEFLNKLDVPIELSVGSNPSLSSPIVVQPNGGKYATTTNASTKLIFREKGKSEIAFLYELTTQPGKKMYVRVISSGGGAKFEPQTFVLNNINKDNIKLIKTIGLKKPEQAQPSKPEQPKQQAKPSKPEQPKQQAQPSKPEQPKQQAKPSKPVSPYQILGIRENAPVSPYQILGIRENANDEEILSLGTANKKINLNDKDAVKKAYRTLSLIWHPDKRTTNETAIARYARSDVKNLSDDENKALATQVMQLINGAYERHK